VPFLPSVSTAQQEVLFGLHSNLMRSPLHLNSTNLSFTEPLSIGHPFGDFPSLIKVALLPGAKVPSSCMPSRANVKFCKSVILVSNLILIIGAVRFWTLAEVWLGGGGGGAVIVGGGGGAEDLISRVAFA